MLADYQEAVAAGNADFIDANLARLEGLISLYQDRILDLAKLQYRARVIRDQHERSAADRLRQ